METIEELKQQNDILNARLEKAKQVFKEMKEKENSLNARIEELENAAGETTSNVGAEWKAKAEELIVNNELLSDELNNAQTKIEALQENLNSVETEKEKALSAMENVINELNTANNRLELAQNELALSQETIENYKADLADASEKIMLQDNAIGTIQMQLDEATAELKALMGRHALSLTDATLLFAKTAELRETYVRGITNIDAIEEAIKSLADSDVNADNDANDAVDEPEILEVQKTCDAQVKKQTVAAQATQKTGSLPGLNDFNINI